MGNVVDFMSYKKKESRVSLITKRQINNLYILIGVPCSGKSTYSVNNFNNPNTVIVSTDEIRKELTGTYSFSKETNGKVFEVAKLAIQKFLDEGYDVVFDATNTNKKYRKAYIEIGKKCSVEIVGIVFNTPLKMCLLRNSMRDNDRKVPEDIIVKMADFDSNISLSEGFNEVIVVDKKL